MDVREKVVIITGASAGIGQATARVFAQAGARLALAARSAEALEQLAAELRAAGGEAVAIRTDMRDQQQVRHMVAATVEQFGGVDVLINNAGQAAWGPIADVDLDHVRQIVDLNLFGSLYAIQAVVPLLRQRGGGLIINVSSNVTKMTIPGIGTYAATKSALNMLSATARVELAADNIRVITVYPRLTATDFGRNALASPVARGAWRPPVPPDRAELVAEHILAAAQREPAEQFVEDAVAQ